MNLEKRFVAGLVVVFCTVTVLNFYVFDRFSSLLGLGNPWISWTYGLLLSIFLGVGFMVRNSTSRDIKLSFMTVTSIFALEFSSLTFLLVFELVNLFHPLPRQESAIFIISCVASIAIVSAVNAQLISVRHISVDFSNTLTLAHISDLHIGTVHGTKYLERLVEKVNLQSPDIVAITGDIVSGATEPVPGMFDPLSKLEGSVFMVTGNHEFYEGPENILATLPPNVQVLRDQGMNLSGYSVYGLDYGEEQGIVGARILNIPASSPVILLTHVPQFLELPQGSIILAGHYHAGQVFPVSFVARFFVKYFKGIYKKDGVTLHVSPGTATWGPPMRFGSRNEITIIELAKR